MYDRYKSTISAASGARGIMGQVLNNCYNASLVSTFVTDGKVGGLGKV